MVRSLFPKIVRDKMFGTTFAGPTSASNTLLYLMRNEKKEVVCNRYTELCIILLLF